MASRESSLWKWLRDGTKHLVPRLHMQRIENSIATGTPDVEGVFNGVAFVLELKSVDARANGKVDCEVSVEQAMFARARVKAGGNAWILVQMDRTHRYLINGKNAAYLTSSDMTTRRLFNLATGPLASTPVSIIMTMTGKHAKTR